MTTVPLISHSEEPPVTIQLTDLACLVGCDDVGPHGDNFLAIALGVLKHVEREVQILATAWDQGSGIADVRYFAERLSERVDTTITLVTKMAKQRANGADQTAPNRPDPAAKQPERADQQTAQLLDLLELARDCPDTKNLGALWTAVDARRGHAHTPEVTPAPAPEPCGSTDPKRYADNLRAAARRIGDYASTLGVVRDALLGSDENSTYDTDTSCRDVLLRVTSDLMEDGGLVFAIAQAMCPESEDRSAPAEVTS